MNALQQNIDRQNAIIQHAHQFGWTDSSEIELLDLGKQEAILTLSIYE